MAMQSMKLGPLGTVDDPQRVGLYSPFGELIVAERTEIIELKSTYGLSALRDVQTVSGSATITHQTDEFRLRVTGSTDTAELDSAERGRYLPGQGAEAGIGIRIPTAPTGNQTARWGLYDDSNGFGFAQDASNVKLFRRRATSDTEVNQSSWNVDKLDGTGPSGVTLNTANGNIYQVKFAWYGYGVIEWVVVTDGTDGVQRPIVVHRDRVDSTTSVQNPNLPLRAENASASTAGNFDVYVAGRQYSVIGRYDPNTRINADYRLALGSVSTTILPLVSFRRKSAFESVAVKCDGFDIITDQPLLVQLRLNGSLTSASYGTPNNTTASETACEVDVAATAISNGELLWEGLVEAAGAGASRSGFSSKSLVDIDVPQLQPVTLCVRKAGATDATVSSVLRWREEW